MTMMGRYLLLLAGIARTTYAFVPQALVRPTRAASVAQNLFDPTAITDVFSNAESILSSTNLLSFTDQGQNLAGIFFQASLLPYLLFLYFLSFPANRIPALGNYGFQFVLLFVISTIPSGIISKSVYGFSLADTDWLHGGAETLLTVANILIVLGFKEAMTQPTDKTPINKARLASLGVAGAFALACATGAGLGFEGHSAFLLGAGNLPNDLVVNLPWVSHFEPENALSIPTWAIHFSSVLEYLFAMNLVWQFSEATDNPKWKGLTWGMLPLHASGICACTYHFFYNPSALQFLVTSQAGLTLLGNITCMIAAYRIAQSNGWSIEDVNPFGRSATSPRGLLVDDLATQPLQAVDIGDDDTKVLAAKLVGATFFLSYAVKYGELGIDLPFTPNAPVALAMILGIPALTAFTYYRQSDGTLALPSLPGNSELSMTDVKKYGVAGTVAYVLTELAFWIVAFPAAAIALYNTTGHWPDVLNDTGDRAAVLGFIFAGANIARAFVPLRLGAALALAPWVDENLLKGRGEDSVTTDQ